MILGSLDGIETGIRQLVRKVPGGRTGPPWKEFASIPRNTSSINSARTPTPIPDCLSWPAIAGR
jgi:hypothetical protein